MDVKYYQRELFDYLLLGVYWLVFAMLLSSSLSVGIIIAIVALPLAQVLILKAIGAYRMTWQYPNLFHFVTLTLLNLFFTASFFLVVTDWNIAFTGLAQLAGGFFSISFLTLANRIYWYFRLNPESMKKITGERSVIIYGAGTVAMNLLHDLGTDDLLGRYHISTIVDKDAEKVGSRLGPYKIQSATDLPRLVAKYRAKEVWLTMPVDPAFMQDMLDHLNEYSIIYKVVPRNFRHILPDIRSLRIEDLVKRPEIKLSYEPLRKVFDSKRIFITGAAGSIGSEIAKQILTFDVKRVVLVDQDEHGIYQMERTHANDSRVICTIADVRDANRISSLILSEKPEFIFHAAAYKHVPLMENHFTEAVQTNVLGTYNLLQAAGKLAKNQTKKFNLRFVNISTDKAVSPENIMGLTKRISELLVYNMSTLEKNGGGLQTVSVRFGNVLSSSGSVVPLFWEQIEKGGPLSVTHPDMERFFMTIPEAVNLVLHSVLQSTGDDILALDMGKPVKIVELAKRLILLSGHTLDKEIKIEFTGKRPGEKLKEELFWTKNSQRTENLYIFRSREDLRKLPPHSVIQKIKKAIEEDYSLRWWKTFLKQFM
ncbi:MAG: nucleoside-diphosphate sugar epimerase/dehydratase [Leptospirales bacterium]